MIALRHEAARASTAPARLRTAARPHESEATDISGAHSNQPPLDERIHDIVARDLGIAIVRGNYLPGDTLPGENVASEKLGIGRPSYREAIRMLSAKGLVESRPKAGTRVSPRTRWNLLDPDVLAWILQSGPDPDFVASLFELRMVVEPAAAALAAGRRSDEQLARMATSLAEMRVGEHDSPAAQAADEHFHEALLEASGNEILIRLASVIAVSVGYVAMYKRERHIPRDPWPDHEALFTAIAAREPATARTLMLGLLEHARDDTVR